MTYFSHYCVVVRSSTHAGIPSVGSATDYSPPKRLRSPPASFHSLSAPDCQDGPNETGADCGRRSDQRSERSRRRLAAFLREHASSTTGEGGRCPEHRSITRYRVGMVSVEGRGTASPGAKRGDISICHKGYPREGKVVLRESVTQLPSRACVTELLCECRSLLHSISSSHRMCSEWALLANVLDHNCKQKTHIFFKLKILLIC